MKNFVFNSYDLDAAKILNDFLPERLFDAHMHVSHCPVGAKEQITAEEYRRDMRPLLGDRIVRLNQIIWPTQPLKCPKERKKSVDFLVQNLEQYPEDVGEIMVMPWDSAEDIEKQLVHSRIRGLKCYHIYADRDKTFDAYIGEYLPESAWEVANKHKMPITLHMVRDHALADPGNLSYIKEMAKKYPDAVLILAHAGRAFAAWTAFGTVDELVPFENVWFDFSGVCESPAMTWILKKVGAKRCMWGSDYTVSMSAGKCVALGDAFYWIGEKDLPNFSSITTLHNWHAGTENLMAVRQATEILELPRGDIEDLFYNTAASLFDR